MHHAAGPYTARLDCWNHIGVWGDATCPQLDHMMHCRSCPVYTAGGRQMLERAPPEASLPASTDWLSEGHTEFVAADAIALLIFRLGAVWLALPTGVCKEVTEMRAIHSLPHRRGGVLLGLVNIRGEIYMCIALRQLLDLEPATDSGTTVGHKAQQRLLVVERATERWVFVVDEIAGIHYVDPGALQHAPVIATIPAWSQGIIDWHERRVSYLDTARLFATLNREIL